MDEAGRRVLRFHLARMIGCERGTREGQDIEALHDMRVATRRLRVACRVFKKTFGKKVLAPFCDQLRQIGTDLGDVRDFDVFIEFVEACRRDQRAHRPAGFDGILAHLRQERDVSRARLIRQLNSTRYAAFKRRFNVWLDGSGDGAAERPKAGRRTIRRAAPALLDRRLSKVMAYRKRLDDHPSPEVLHTLRIACKRLRYTAEFFRDCYDERLDSLIARMVELQDLLGRFHDADVRVHVLTDYLDRLDRPSSRARQETTAIQGMCEAERRVQRETLERFWTVWEEGDTEFRGLDCEL